MSIVNLQSNTVTVAPKSEVDKIRTPDVIYSTGYLNDPIQFTADKRFEPQTVVQQFNELPNQLERDFAEFVQVDANNDKPQLLTINMFSTTLKPVSFGKVFSSRVAFKQLGISK